jgi:hypothetical protein
MAGWLKRRQEPAPERSASEPPAGEEVPDETSPAPSSVPEIGGPKGPEPTRYGDWEKGGRCTDF